MPTPTRDPARSVAVSVVAAALALAPLAAPSRARAQGWMHWPTDRATSARRPLTQGFYGNYIAYCGARDGCGTHNGYDYGIPTGTPLFAVAPGVVDAVNGADVRTADYGNAGLWVRVRHDGSTVPGLAGTFFVSYLHMSRIDVAVGARVTTTTRVGLSGASGGVAPHLHLHVATARNYCGAPVDPGCPTPAWVGGSVIPSAFSDAPGCQSVCRPVRILWVQPAAYGNEAYRGASPCGSLDYAGRCDGEVLHWCESNAHMTADCAARNAVCAFQDTNVGYNCLRCDPALMRPLLPGPRCEGARWLRCEGTTARSTNCAALGQRCTPTGCEPFPVEDAGPPAMDAAGVDAGAADGSIDVEVTDGLGAVDAGGGAQGMDGGGGARDGAGDAQRSGRVTGGCGCVVAGAEGAAGAAGERAVAVVVDGPERRDRGWRAVAAGVVIGLAGACGRRRGRREATRG